MRFILAVTLLAACGDQSSNTSLSFDPDDCDTVVTDDVAEFAGIALADELPNGAGTFVYEGFNHDGPVSVTLDVMQAGPAQGLNRTNCQAFTGDILRVPVDWTITASDGYLSLAGTDGELDFSPSLSASPMFDVELIPSQAVTPGGSSHPFSYRTDPAEFLRIALVEEAMWVSECFNTGLGVQCFEVYTMESDLADVPEQTP